MNIHHSLSLVWQIAKDEKKIRNDISIKASQQKKVEELELLSKNNKGILEDLGTKIDEALSLNTQVNIRQIQLRSA
ncbi:MAG: hypothetical protein COB30_003005 [Ectothiorhodospiraceae bacterium]|nr:hypothetical protein [Ectothiorhodospiraceae bacterium]MBN4053060.1 hypothetical protein [Gammaproteobacteria bacterium AH-315-K14]